LQWLNAQMSEISRTEPHRQIAIFTHHSSTLDGRAVDERHKDSPAASGFGTDLRRRGVLDQSDCGNVGVRAYPLQLWLYG
jgi:hypothetical protein